MKIKFFIFAVLLISGQIAIPETASASGFGWQIQMMLTGKKTPLSGTKLTSFGSPGSSSFQLATATNTSANSRTSLGSGEGAYDAFFNQTGITKVALVDGTGNSLDPTTHNNYLVYDLVESTGAESFYAILKRLDEYQRTATNFHNNDNVWLSNSAINHTAGYSGTLSAYGGTDFKTTAAGMPGGVAQYPDRFAVLGLNRDADNDLQALAAYWGNLDPGNGKSDRWRLQDPYQTFWSYWGNDFYRDSKSERIGSTYQTSPGVSTGASWTGNVYLLAYSGSSDVTPPTFLSAVSNSDGLSITLAYDESMSSTTSTSASLTILADGAPIGVATVTASGSNIVLALSSSLRIGQNVTVAYTEPSASNDLNAIQDTSGNDAASFAATNVTNNSTIKPNQATFTFAGGSTTYGTNLRLQSSGGSGTGAISYAVSSGSCAVSNTDSLTASSAGSCVVVARKATDSTYLDAYDTKTVTVNKASQAKLTIGQYTAFVGVSTYPINVYGGSGTGAISRTLSAPGSANCTLQSGLFVQAASVGSCTITAVKASDTNYLAETTTAAIYWVQWSDAYATRVPSVPTGIDLQHKTQITKYNFETLTVTSYKDGFGNPVTSITANSQLRIIGDGFNAADTTTEVVFGNAEIVDMNYSSPALQVVSDGSGGYYLLVTVPSGAGTDNVVVNSAKGTAMGPVLTIL